MIDSKMIAVFITLFWGVITYFWKRSDSKRDEEVKLLKDGQLILGQENTDRKQEITELKGKLWNEDKLTKTVTDAVGKEFLKWENKLLKEEIQKNDHKKS